MTARGPSFRAGASDYYMLDPASTTVVSFALPLIMTSPNVSGNSNLGTLNYGIYQEGGAWSSPFPDLRIGYETGISIGANASYEGIRFYSNTSLGALVMQINGANNYTYFNQWVQLTSGTGFYSGTNSAHLYPNPSSYGSWKILGSKNGWNGIEFVSGMALMANNTDCGFYKIGTNWYAQINGKTFYSRGEVTAYYSDRRLKDNIRSLNQGEGIEIVDKLVPSEFEWNEISAKVNSNFIPGTKEVALIAQEVQEIIPIAVGENKAGRSLENPKIESYLTIKYDRITPYLIQAVKDLKPEIDNLKQEIKSLKEMLNHGIH